jgi:membrane protein required for colicin V production
MNWLDILILVVLIISAISGLVSGFIKTVFSLVGLIVAIILAGKYYVSLADHLGFIHSEAAAHIVAFLIIFLVVILVATILGFIFTKIASAILLGWLNRILGAALGVVMGGLTIAALLALWVHFMGSSATFEQSGLAKFLLDKVPIVLGLLPGEFGGIKDYFR